jgi:hypothetical protein
VARSNAPLTSSQAHEAPSFARLDLLESLNTERRSIDVAGVGALVIATIARCTAWRGSRHVVETRHRHLLRRMENQKDWQEGQLRMKRPTSSTASFARTE